MPIPTTVADLSTTASANYPAGSESPNQLDDYHRALASIVRQVSDAKANASHTHVSGDVSGLGTAATLNVGTSANQIVQLNGSAQLPAVDGSLLTGISSLPSQTGNSGKVLSTNGSSASWSKYGAAAWCLFNGATAGTNAPTAGGNVTSVTRNSAGNWTINFTTALADTNFSVMAMGRNTGTYVPVVCLGTTANTTTSVNVTAVAFGAGTSLDCEMHVVVFK